MDEPPIGLMFPGQGTQYEGMGLPWREAESWPLVADISEWTGQDVEELLLRTGNEDLRRTDLAQIAIFTVGVLAYHEAVRAWKPVDIAGYAGHSLGEYVALVAAGVLDVRSAAVLVAARGRAMLRAANQSPGTMAVLVGGSHDEAQALVERARGQGHQVWVANVNADGQTVVSGTDEGVGHLAAEAPTIGAKAIRIPVGGAFHSPLMARAREELADALADVTFSQQHGTVVANVDARPYRSADWAALEARQLTSPVLWKDSVETLTGELGCRRLAELGPGRTLTGLVRRIDPNVELVTVSSPAAL